MSQLKAIIEGEYYNNADLMGIDTENTNEILGKINRLPQKQKAQVIHNTVRKPLTAAAVASGNSRLEFESKVLLLPDEDKAGLISQRSQLVDTRFYVVKDISGKNNVDLFQGTDNKSIALANVANSKLEKANWFLLSAIQVQYGEGSDKNVVDFQIVPSFIRNGEFELEAGNKKLIGLMDGDAFFTKGRTDIPNGYYKLHNTKFIEPQVEIKMPFKFSGNAPQGAFLKVTFIGTSIIPY